MGKKEDLSHIYQNPVELLRKLIRFDTTNPPGNESDCIAFINHLLTQAGIATAAPLLLYGHIDVVTTENQQWRHPPFAGKLVDEFIYGRGALDMKGGVTMMLAALLRAKAENLRPPGDIILAIVCDEEAFGDYGAKFLVEKHPEEFDGIRYAIGEFGGFTLAVWDKGLAIAISTLFRFPKSNSVVSRQPFAAQAGMGPCRFAVEPWPSCLSSCKG